jgi:anti-anti-sigma regulatory factor
MLKITIMEKPTEQRLILEGRLTGPDVSELQSVWENARRTYQLRSWVVDLRNVTFIDDTAEGILLDMNKEGAQFMACGVANRYRLEQLGIKCSVMIACQSVGGAPTG